MRRILLTHRALAAVALVLATAACSSRREELGNANVTVTIAGSTAAVARVSAEIGLGGWLAYRNSQDLAQSGAAQWKGLVTGIPAGAELTLHVIARDARGTATYSKDVALTIPPQGTVNVFVTLGGEDGTLPIIDLVIVQPTAHVGETIPVHASAHDPLGYPLSYGWSSTCGVFADPTILSPLWTAPPDPGTCSLTLSADDGHGHVASATVPVVVVQLDGSADVDVAVLQPPALTVLADLQLDAAMTGTLEVVASSPNGLLDPVWVTSGCAGLVLDATPPRSAFEPAIWMPGPSPACSLGVTLTDVLGASSTGVVLLPPNCAPCAAGQVCLASGACGALP
jgi:hypothetical protein